MIITSPSTAATPSVQGAPFVELKRLWTDSWEFRPDIELVNCGIHAGGNSASSATLLRRYGQGRYPFEAANTQRTALDLSAWWVRVSFPPGPGDQGPRRVFCGFVEAENRDLLGPDPVPAGEQRWVAAGGLAVLRRLVVDSAVATNGGTDLQFLDWIPPMNSRDKHDVLVGNRSDNTVAATSGSGGAASYVYGGKNLWTHTQYIQYLLSRVTAQTAGPVWTLTGQTSILDQLQSTIKFPEPCSAADMLRKLIPPKFGIDFTVTFDAKGTGFQIDVFSLASADATYGGATLPKNPQGLLVDRNDPRMIDCKIVRSREKSFDQIVVQGRRIVVCGTLYATPPNNTSASQSSNLLPRWATFIEDDYTDPEDAPDDADGTDLDRLRRREKYRDVYQSYGAPATWDLNGGAWAVTCDDQGNVQKKDGDGNNTSKLNTGTYQTTIRRTLPYIPLQEGFDYSTNPAADNRIDSTVDTHLRPPLAWIYDTEPDDGSSRLEQADLVGVSVHAPDNDWGVFLQASPNHLLAANHFKDADGSDPLTDGDARYDYTKFVATVALESDHRLKVGYTLPKNLAAGDGSIMTINDDGAECWVLLPNTVLDLDADGKTVLSGAAPRILRNDVARLNLLLAGAKARYANDRVRAQLTFRGLLPMSGLLGQMLSTIQQGDDVASLAAPVTAIEWDAKQMTTIIRTGYA